MSEAESHSRIDVESDLVGIHQLLSLDFRGEKASVHLNLRGFGDALGDAESVLLEHEVLVGLAIILAIFASLHNAHKVSVGCTGFDLTAVLDHVQESRGVNNDTVQVGTTVYDLGSLIFRDFFFFRHIFN